MIGTDTTTVQLVGYDPTPDAGLLVAEAGNVRRIPLRPGTELSFELEERTCAGTVEDGVHVDCSRPESPYCPEHTDTWVCARCRGSCLKDQMDCFDPHVVYLAVVAPAHLKVGVTKAERISTRLHEQGADRGAVIHNVKNGRIAREIEAEIGQTLPERIRISAKINSLQRAVDEQVWDELLSAYDVLETYEPSYDLELTGVPIPDTLASGRVVGTKGRLLALAVGGTTYVSDMRDLVGYSVTKGDANPSRQSGLGAFT